MTALPNIVLVHGAWADGSSWSAVMACSNRTTERALRGPGRLPAATRSDPRRGGRPAPRMTAP